MYSTHHSMKLLTSLILTALLSACTVGPNFVEPQKPSTKSFTHDGDQLNTANQQIHIGQTVSSTWWQAFGSSQLNDLMAQALSGNRNLASMQATLAQAQAQVEAITGTEDPQVSLGGNVGRQKYGKSLFGPSDFHIPPFTYYSIGPQVSYFVDFAGGKRRSIEQQKALAAYQVYETQATELSLTGDVAAQVVALASAKTQIDIIQKIILDDQKNIELIQTAQRIGSATVPDLLNAQNQLATDQSLLPPLQQQLSAATHALAVLVGKAPADWQAPNFNFAEFHLPSELPLSLPSELVRARPDIMAAESQLHAASAAIGVAKANQYPSLTLSANMTQQALSPAKLFDLSSNAWALAGGLSAPLLNGGTLKAQNRAAEAAYRSAAASYQQVVIQSFAQVADVLKSLEHNNQEVQSRQSAQETAQTTLKMTQLSYQIGNIGIPQILDADKKYHEAELNFARAKVQQFADTARLYLALGGGVLTQGKP